MAFINMVDWNPTSDDIYAWRYPETNLTTATQLLVSESQEAVFFSKGQIIGKFGPGKHTLSTENIPLLHKLYGIPFGGKNPFTAEVWFVNKTARLTIDWTSNGMRYLDPMYQQMLILAAGGRYGVTIKDAERFLVKLVGSLSQFTSHDLTDHFYGPLLTKTKSSILSYMKGNNLGIMDVSADLDGLSSFLHEPMAAFWEEYGVDLVGFYISSIDIDTSTKEGQDIAAALASRTAQSISGYTWQQQQSFEVANNALSGGGDMGMLGAVMMTGAMSNGGGGMGAGMMQTPQGQSLGQQMGGGYASQGQPQGFVKKDVFCSNCSKKFPNTSKFCPFCGDPAMLCPVCGADNDEHAKRCVTCGSPIAASGVITNCSRCNAPVTEGVAFCTNCGNKIS